MCTHSLWLICTYFRDSLYMCIYTPFVTNMYWYFVTRICTAVYATCVYIHTQFVTNMHLYFVTHTCNAVYAVYVYVYTVRDWCALMFRDSYLRTPALSVVLALQRETHCIRVCIHSSWLKCMYFRDSLYTCVHTQSVTNMYLYFVTRICTAVHTVYVYVYTVCD